MVALLLTCLGMALAGLSISHMQLTSQRLNGEIASNRASSLVDRALSRILADPEYGTRAESLNPQEGSRLTFEQNGERVYSTNNVRGRSAVVGWNDRVVPREGVHLVSEVEVAGARRRVEAIFAVPAYPYAVASTVPVITQGTLTVGAVESPADIAFLEERMLPGDLVSNSPDSPAVVLGSEAVISGDLRAVGEIQVDQGATVMGVVRSGAEPAAVPRMELSRYEPGEGTVQLDLGGATEVPYPLTGLFRHRGSLELSGPLTLDNGLLFVDGDLTVRLDSRGRGGLQGRGALVATGSVTIHGGSQFQEDSGVALLSGGDVRLLGGGRLSSFFQGLIYSRGSVEASDVTLLGSLIVDSGPGGAVTLRDARTIHLDEMTSFEVPEPLLTGVTEAAQVVTPTIVMENNYQFSTSYDPVSRQLSVSYLGGTFQHWISGRQEAPSGVQREGQVLTFDVPNTHPEPLVIEVTDEMLTDRRAWPELEIPANVPLITPQYTSHPWLRGSRQTTLPMRVSGRLLDYLGQAGQTGSSRYTFDPNRFLSLSEKIRPVYWGEH